MEKFTPSELCADIKIYDYKQKVKYDEKSLVIFEKTGKMITAGKECECMLYTLPANSIGFSPIVLGRVSDYTCAEKMLKQMLCRYLGMACADIADQAEIELGISDLTIDLIAFHQFIVGSSTEAQHLL